MTTGHVYIATSLDGFVSGPAHELEWLTSIDTQGEDMGYTAFMDSVDGLVMGRGSYETVLSFGGEWPYTKPVYVMSRTLTEAQLPERLRGKVWFSQHTPQEMLAFLDEKGWKRAYIDGGRLVQSFLRAGLIEDLIITVAPVLLGGGIRLFGELPRAVSLDLLATQHFKCGMAQSHYRIRPT